MRPIKFRAWNSVQEKMVYNPTGDGFINDTFQSTATIYQQFTGLLDKNGKEIYEGDIVRLAENILALTVWDIECAAFQSQRIGDFDRNATDRSSHLYGSQFTEVIGNIYENLDLID